MEVLDEKANGTPMIEIEEVVPVTNRTYRHYHSSATTTFICTMLHSDEAFAAKYMPDLAQDVKDFKVFEWPLSNWKKLEKKLTSPEFECGGHKWWVVSVMVMAVYITHPQLCDFRRILLFPFGNSNAPPNDTVSVYLDYAEPKKSPEGWHACAQFALVISNPNDPTIYTVSRECMFSCLQILSYIIQQMPTIVSLPRNVTGGSRDFVNFASSSQHRRATLDPR